jgi:MSHA pilin protein MshA
MTNKQQGFTLIELVAVIVILGALAIVALPRFINLQDEAQSAALDGVTGSAGAAHAVNLAGALAGDSDAQSMTDCDDTGNLMQGGSPTGYTYSGTFASSVTGASTTCTVNGPNDGSTTFTGYYVS